MRDYENFMDIIDEISEILEAELVIDYKDETRRYSLRPDSDIRYMVTYLADILEDSGNKLKIDGNSNIFH